MTTPNLVQISLAPQPVSSSSPLAAIALPTLRVPKLYWLSVLSLVMATLGLGVAADRSTAQVTYYERAISVSAQPGVVSTNSGIGLNIRSGPGLSFPVIGGAEDGNSLQLIGAPVVADGYRWQRVATGGWAASDFVNGGFVNVSVSNDCLRQISACGGDSTPVQPIQPPIYRPISVSAGPYVAAVPGGVPTLYQVQRVVGGARLDRAREGSFVNAGGFATHDGAQAMTSFLRANGFDARVIYK